MKAFICIGLQLGSLKSKIVVMALKTRRCFRLSIVAFSEEFWTHMWRLGRFKTIMAVLMVKFLSLPWHHAICNAL